jgi:hypothetical protein
VLEKGLDGSLITVLEDEGSAKKFLETKTAGKDLILDFSLIRLPKPLPNAEKLRYMKVKMQGIDPSLIAEDHRQKVVRQPDKLAGDSFEVVVRVEDLSPSKTTNEGSANPSYSDDHLASTVEIQADHAEIAAQGKQIVADNDPPREKITKLVHWTADNIQSAMRYSFAALEVLRVRSGECKSHANLYAALARSQKIPTRVITGLVYSNEGGFSYHAWAESYTNGWIAVDPTLKQIPADATHIKIAASEPGSATSSLIKMMGKVKMEVLEHHN